MRSKKLNPAWLDPTFLGNMLIKKAVGRKRSSGTDWTLFIYDLLIAGLTNFISVLELEVRINYNRVGLNYVLEGFNLQQNLTIFAWFKIEYSPSTFNHVCEQINTGLHSQRRGHRKGLGVAIGMLLIHWCTTTALMQIVKVMNGMEYDQGMIYLTNIQRMRYVDKNWKRSVTGNVDIVVHW